MLSCVVISKKQSMMTQSFSHGIQKKQKDPMMMEETAHISCAIHIHVELYGTEFHIAMSPL